MNPVICSLTACVPPLVKGLVIVAVDVVVADVAGALTADTGVVTSVAVVDEAAVMTVLDGVGTR